MWVSGGAPSIAHKTMPWDLKPMRLRGFRLQTTTRRCPSICSSVYQSRKPEAIWRGSASAPIRIGISKDTPQRAAWERERSARTAHINLLTPQPIGSRVLPDFGDDADPQVKLREQRLLDCCCCCGAVWPCCQPQCCEVYRSAAQPPRASKGGAQPHPGLRAAQVRAAAGSLAQLWHTGTDEHTAALRPRQTTTILPRVTKTAWAPSRPAKKKSKPAHRLRRWLPMQD